MYWNCPKCNSKVEFYKQMDYVFEYREADFDPNRGLFFHTIECENEKCDAYWVTSISEMYNIE